MIVTFLGTGTSQGVPVIGCGCPVCTSIDYRDKRLRSSVHIAVEGKSIVIDTGPDFRQQMLRSRISHIDAVLYTHEHKDHVAGMDEIRAFNFLQKKAIPLYATKRVIERLKVEFEYAFAPIKYPGVPHVELVAIDDAIFEVEGITIIPITVMHAKLPVKAFRIGRFTYITDANYIAPEEIEKIKGSDVVVINGLQQDKHLSHFNLKQAIEVIEEIAPKKAYITHISHRLGLHSVVQQQLPDFVHLAYDGLQINLDTL